MGRQAIGKRPMTAAERMRRMRRKMKLVRVSARGMEKKAKRAAMELALADRISAARTELDGLPRCGVLYVDPPWRFEVYSRDTGMDRSADNHYPTMSDAEIGALPVPAGQDCVLFLWSTVAKLPDALRIMSDWGFTYKSAYAWHKPGHGTGYWSQAEQIEHLLVGTRGRVPAPAPGTQPPQMITAPRGRHSEKPEAFAEMIERMFPNTPKIELFARRARPGWAVWGAEAAT